MDIAEGDSRVRRKAGPRPAWLILEQTHVACHHLPLLDARKPNSRLGVAAGGKTRRAAPAEVCGRNGHRPASACT
jgi:hypothetical protein